MNIVKAMSEAFREVTGITQLKSSTFISQQKAQIPSELSKVVVLPMPSPEILQDFVNTNRVQINEYIFKKLKTAIKKDLSDVILWRVGNSDKFARIERKEYLNVIGQFKDFFIKTEQYEKITMCDKLVNKHNINKVIYEANEEYHKDNQ